MKYLDFINKKNEAAELPQSTQTQSMQQKALSVPPQNQNCEDLQKILAVIYKNSKVCSAGLDSIHNILKSNTQGKPQEIQGQEQKLQGQKVEQPKQIQQGKTQIKQIQQNTTKQIQS